MESSGILLVFLFGLCLATQCFLYHGFSELRLRDERQQAEKGSKKPFLRKHVHMCLMTYNLCCCVSLGVLHMGFHWSFKLAHVTKVIRINTMTSITVTSEKS